LRFHIFIETTFKSDIYPSVVCFLDIKIVYLQVLKLHFNYFIKHIANNDSEFVPWWFWI